MKKKIISLTLALGAILGAQSCNNTEKETSGSKDTVNLVSKTLEVASAALNRSVPYDSAKTAVDDYRKYIASGSVVLKTESVDFSSAELIKWIDGVKKAGGKFDKISMQLGVYNKTMVNTGARAEDQGKLSIFIFLLDGNSPATWPTTNPITPVKVDPYNLGDIHPK